MPISANHNVNDFDIHNVETQEQSSALAYKTPRESKGTGFQLSNFEATILATVIPLYTMQCISAEHEGWSTVISIPNTAHAVIFPLMFIASVKIIKCCKK